jgi:hypothetical protein
MPRDNMDETVSRRRLLTVVGAGGVALAGGPALAVGQANNSSGDGGPGDRRLTTPAIIPITGQISATDDYTGFFLHLTRRLESPGDTSIAGLKNCKTAGWTPNNPHIFEVQIITVGEETDTIGSTVYLPRDLQPSAGQLFIINSQQRCGGEAYISIQIEELLAQNVSRGFRTNTTGAGTGDTEGAGGSGASGPGFGLIAAVGGLLAGGYTLARRTHDEK